MLIAQITDMHAGGRVEVPAGELDTTARLARAVDHLNGLTPRPDLVLATGDLTWNGELAEYEALRGELDRLDMPVYLLPGNHDDRDNLRAVFADHGYLPAEGFLHYTIEDHPLRIVALDTLLPGSAGGLLCAERLAWLAATLGDAPDRPTLLAQHHPPFDIGMPFFDHHSFQGGAGLGDIVARNPQVEMIICGHIHRAVTRRWHGTVVAVAPSPSFQYPLVLREDPDVRPVDEPPACRLCLWQGDAGLISHLSYIAG